MKKLSVLVLLLVVTMLFVTACGSSEGDNGNQEFATIVDDMDREVVIPEKPEKIISLSPSNTEIAFALGLADRVVGVTDFCDYPEEASEKATVGGFSDPNMEVIVDLEPDLVLAGNMHQEVVEQLETLSIPVIVVNPTEIEEVYSSLELVAAAAGAESEAAEVLADMKETISTVQAKVETVPEAEKVKVYYEIYSDPLMSVGAKSFINEVITLAGGINIFADLDNDYPQVSSEMVAEQNPDVIMFPDYHGSEELFGEQIEQRAGWTEINAVVNNRMYGVNDNIFSRSGPRLAEAVELAAHVLYPSLFE